MGEAPARHVAHGIDAAVRRAQPAVQPQPAAIERHAGQFEAEAIQIGLASDGDEQVGAIDGLFERMAGQIEAHAPVTGLHMTEADAFAQDDALLRQPGEHRGSQFGILLRQCPLGFEYRHLAAEAAKGLRQFEADGPRA